MKKRLPLIAMLAMVVAGMLSVDMAEAAGKGKWKLGRVYFRMVCTACHIEMTGAGIAPNTRTIAEWTTYMDADAHDASGKSEPKISSYTSKEYRESIKDKNKAAKKLLKVPNEDLFEHVKSFLEHGAKDSDTPASCG